MFSSRNFMVSGQVQIFDPFELILGYGIRESANFILLHEAVQFSQHHFLKTVLFHCIFFGCFVVN